MVIGRFPHEPGQPRLYDDLVLGGAAVTLDPTRRWMFGRDDVVDLLVCATTGEVRVRAADGDRQASPHLTAVVLNYYRRQIEDCDNRRRFDDDNDA
jgi:hypothetical protein